MPRVFGNGTSKNQKNYAPIYEKFGVRFISNGDPKNIRAEECPFCGEDKFYLNVETGQYDCKKCLEKGNITTYLSWIHKEAMNETSSVLYSQMAKKRGVSPQALRRWGLAYNTKLGCWMIPFYTAKGSVANIQLYYPERDKPNKSNLPVLPTCIFGFNELSNDKNKPVFICEGPFDAIALNYKISDNNRKKYDIIATPGAFKDGWVDYFRGRKVRLLYDNDDAGRRQSQRVEKLLGESRIAEEVLVLKWAEGTPDKYDINDLIRDNPSIKPIGYIRDHCFKILPEPKIAWEFGWERETQEEEVIEWIWPNRMRCGTYISYSGRRGTLKSTLMREIIAKYTKGENLPCCEKVGLPANKVIYITAEDGKEEAWADFRRNGADIPRIIMSSGSLKDDSQMNIIEQLEELRQTIRQYGVRFVVIDGQNSVVGAPNISTDMLARHNITNKLHQFAQRENLCLVGIRNEDREGRAYGPASMSDIGRCILRSVKLDQPEGASIGEVYFRLIFERISDAAPSTHPPIPYSVADLGGPARKILWGKSPPPPIPLQDGDAERFVARLKARGKGQARKTKCHSTEPCRNGSTKTPL